MQHSQVRTVQGKWIGWVMALVATLAYSLEAPVAKAAILFGMNPTTLLASRYVIATVFLIGTVGLASPKLFQIDPSKLLVCGAIGFAYSIAVLSFYWSLTRIDASLASMVFSIYPMMVLGLLVIRDEKITLNSGVRLIIGLGGVYLLIGPGGQSDWTGILLVITSLCLFSLHLVLIQWFLEDQDVRTVTLYIVMTISGLVIGLWAIQGNEWHDPGLRGWLSIATLALVCTYLAQLSLFIAIRHIGSGQMALLGPAETLLAVIWSLLFLQERLSFIQWIGGGMIIISVTLVVYRVRKTRLWT